MENRNKSDSRVDCWQVFDSWVCLISQMIEFNCWKIQFHVDMLETLLRADFVEQECISISSHVTSIVSGPTLALVSETLWELLKKLKSFVCFKLLSDFKTTFVTYFKLRPFEREQAARTLREYNGAIWKSEYHQLSVCETNIHTTMSWACGEWKAISSGLAKSRKKQGKARSCKFYKSTDTSEFGISS